MQVPIYIRAMTALLVGAGMLFAGAWMGSMRGEPTREPVPVVDLQRLDRLEVRIKALEDKRSMNIHPQLLHVNIYPVENLGRHKP